MFATRISVKRGVVLALVLGICTELTAASKDAKSAGSTTPADSQAVAAEVDQMILGDLQRAGVRPADQCNDADYLRRASLDITGQLPEPRDLTLFVLDPDPGKRAAVVERLLKSPEYGKNWARYWRDVIYMPAVNALQARRTQIGFEGWMTAELNQDHGWDRIVTAILTATGDVDENPATALVFAQNVQASEIAAESCRIFLGIQMQCADCHDHPSDVWKRTQFHELAAYFPRIGLRQEPGQQKFEIVSVNTDRRPGQFMRENPERFIAMLDRNNDGKLTKEEMRARPGMPNTPAAQAQFVDRMFEYGDTDKDGALSAAELKNLPEQDQARRGSVEHYMPDLNDPSSKGKVIEPKFFINESSPGHGLSDADRRIAVAREFTSIENPWFAKALVNRLWCEFLGEGFYMPVDDLGPTRSARFPEAIDALAAGFASNHYDVKWLVRTIANSQTYQRKVAAKATSEGALPFASVTPTRLRGDVVYNSLLQVLGIDDEAPSGGPGMMMAGPRAAFTSPRARFDLIFGIDPSVPKEDITGNVPQSLFLMNATILRGALSAAGNTRLSKILRDNRDDGDALGELYLLVLAREPSRREVEICKFHLRETGSRAEAYEDVLWGLVNSSEFLSKR